MTRHRRTPTIASLLTIFAADAVLAEIAASLPAGGTSRLQTSIYMPLGIDEAVSFSRFLLICQRHVSAAMSGHISVASRWPLNMRRSRVTVIGRAGMPID